MHTMCGASAEEHSSCPMMTSVTRHSSVTHFNIPPLTRISLIATMVLEPYENAFDIDDTTRKRDTSSVVARAVKDPVHDLSKLLSPATVAIETNRESIEPVTLSPRLCMFIDT